MTCPGQSHYAQGGGVAFVLSRNSVASSSMTGAAGAPPVWEPYCTARLPSGYEVYRFGGMEFGDWALAATTLATFFTALI